MQDIEILWNQILEKLQLRISTVSYTLWLKPVKPIEIDEKSNLILAASSVSAKNQILRNFLDKITDCAFEICGTTFTVVVLDPNEEIEYVNEASKHKEILVLVDPDKAGREIENRLKEKLINATYINVDISRCIRGKKDGVAECDQEEIIKVLKSI